MNERAADLAAALATVDARISRACQAVGRDRSEVRLLAVTKTYPAEDAAALSDLGVVDLAENRAAEAADKVASVRALRSDARPRWHMVGSVQRNKAKTVARWADVVQSVDSVPLAETLHRAVATARVHGERPGPLEVLVQVSLDGDPDRGGCPLDGLTMLADRVTKLSELRLRGVMAIAPQMMAPDAAFARLARAADKLQRDHPQASEISAGMSGDLEQAIAHGATWVRVGTALLGKRGLASP